MTSPAVLAHRRPATRRAGLRVGGIAVRYNQPSDVGGFTEEFRPGAFQNLAAPNILLLRDHDAGRLLARTGSGTLTLADTPSALTWEASLPDTEDGRATHELARRGDYEGASIGFYAAEDHWTPAPPGGKPHRVIIAARLDHLSPVPRPAHDGTGISTRSANLELETRNIGGCYGME